jgi:AraC-like DNA-binding protein
MRQIINEFILLDTSLDLYLGLSIVALMYCMGYIGIKQPIIFVYRNIPLPSSEKNETQCEAKLKPFTKSITQPQENTASRDKEQKVSEKYQNSSLNKQLSGQLYQELDKHMKQQRPYLNNTLSLPELADQLGLSANHLSQTINQQTGKNFFDYVNSYRIEQAKHLLSDPDSSYTILDVSERSGFNSKSAFYTAFRKHVGVTPSHFKKQP